MRKAGRIVFSLLLAYLVQATMLPYFRIGSIILDVVTVVLFTAGFAGGMYAGLMTGLVGALLFEVLAGELPGLTAVFAITSSLYGAYIAIWIAKRHQGEEAKKKRREGLSDRVLPAAAVFALVLVREIIFVVYFYLTGADITLMNLTRAVRCAALSSALAFLLIPILAGFMTRSRKKTFIANWRRRRRSKKLPKRFGPTVELPGGSPLDMPTEGSTQFPTELPSEWFQEAIQILPGGQRNTPVNDGETEAE